MWIEILYLLTNQCSILSLPLRKCGLKYGFLCIQWSNEQVTSLAEVWIEIGFGIIRTRTFAVTSLAEVWIEISSSVAVQSMSWPSLPLRKCGLKWLKMFCTFVLCWVTSLAEVWIEIWSSVKSRRVQGVTSLAEVWIEITLLRGWRNDERSLPLRKCGLKCPFETTLYGVTSHFPCGSVDWNIFNNLRQKIKNLSLPLRKCGLKWNTCWSPWLLSLSLPLRKCGLKFASVPDLIYSYGRHFPCGSVDWNCCNGEKYGTVKSHFPCGSVDWNYHNWENFCPRLGHFPCGSVDWNLQISFSHHSPSVTSLAEVWIEMTLSIGKPVAILSLPLRKCGLKYLWSRRGGGSMSHFPCGSVDWNIEPFYIWESEE